MKTSKIGVFLDNCGGQQIPAYYYDGNNYVVAESVEER